MPGVISEIVSVCKLRIGFAIMLSGLAGLAITPGATPGLGQIILFSFVILLSSASAGAFNQFMERDIDAKMKRTRNRPFVTGRFQADRYWLFVIALMLIISVLTTSLAINPVAALYIFLGAFTYGIVYTVWLKRRTWLNIVIGGLSGSFAVLGGAAVVDPTLSITPVLLAVVMFLWTPPHFWSLAFVFADDYKQAGIPMLPVVFEKTVAAKIIFAHTLALVLVSILPFLYGLGWIYLSGALAGGLYFLKTSYDMMRSPSIKTARTNFRASLIQLTLLLSACVLDVFLA